MNSFRDAVTQGRLGSGPAMPTKRPRQAEGTDDLTGVAIARRESRTRDGRSAQRKVPGDGEIRLFVKRKGHRAELLNLSGGGAMIRTSIALKLWDCVHLELAEGERVECAVRWIKGDRIGLEFAHETQIGGDPLKRDAMLLDAIESSFPEVASSNRGESRPVAQRRSVLRHPLIWSGEILFEFDTTRARLRNISRQGAMVECARNFPDGAEVLLDLGGAGQHFATVSWSLGDQVGLRFKRPFDIACLARSKPQLADERWTRPDYLNTAPGDESPWAEPWRRLTLPELRDTLEGYLKR